MSVIRELSATTPCNSRARNEFLLPMTSHIKPEITARLPFAVNVYIVNNDMPSDPGKTLFSQMQVNIRYADVNKPINMNCKCGVILEHIRKLGNYDAALVLDVCDKDGNVKLLRQNPTTYATSYLSAGETYYLVSATEDPAGKQFVYQNLATLTGEEPQFEVKPTKADKPAPAKRAAPRPAAKARKGK